MRNTHSSIVFALSAAAFAAPALSRLSDFGQALAAYARRFANWSIAAAKQLIPTDARPSKKDVNPVSIKAAAKSFVARLVQRQRPRICSSWRMCASA